MKAERHRKILELISDNAVTTQEELMAMLSDAGFRVTQATVSRDIKELRLIKVQSADDATYMPDPHKTGSPVIWRDFAAFLCSRCCTSTMPITLW